MLRFQLVKRNQTQRNLIQAVIKALRIQVQVQMKIPILQVRMLHLVRRWLMIAVLQTAQVQVRAVQTRHRRINEGDY